MKSNYFNKNTLPSILLFGIIGAILLLTFIIFSSKHNIKAPWGTLIYPLTIFSAILYYKIKLKKNINYWKAVVMTFLVCSVITIPAIVYIIIGRVAELSEMYKDVSLSQLLMPFLFMITTGITISLITGLFFLKFKKERNS